MVVSAGSRLLPKGIRLLRGLTGSITAAFIMAALATILLSVVKNKGMPWPPGWWQLIQFAVMMAFTLGKYGVSDGVSTTLLLLQAE